eukprot:scaffold93870_cov75-Phaeocystis_antarctica.AAC.2
MHGEALPAQESKAYARPDGAYARPDSYIQIKYRRRKLKSRRTSEHPCVCVRRGRRMSAQPSATFRSSSYAICTHGRGLGHSCGLHQNT